VGVAEAEEEEEEEEEGGVEGAPARRSYASEGNQRGASIRLI